MLLFDSYKLGAISLKNRVVMAPMTRSRVANDNIPTKLMAEYYGQRAGAGLIITEGAAPSANGLGYPRIPAIYTQEQIEGWKQVAEAVHAQDSKIFVQLMHTGRASHPDNMPEGATVLGPSPIAMSGKIHTDTNGKQDSVTPQEMTLADIEQTQQEFVQAALNAITAGIDGVEIHGANGYLLDQFINPCSNQRTDSYGGSVENRMRFVIETVQKVAAAIGADKTGIRLSPYGAFNDMQVFDGLEDAYGYLSGELGKLNIAYLHFVDQSDMGAPKVAQSVKDKMQTAFRGPIIASGGFNAQTAEDALGNKKGDLISFGRPFISNPDLVYRMQHNIELTATNSETLYSTGEKGYTDYKMAQQN